MRTRGPLSFIAAAVLLFIASCGRKEAPSPNAAVRVFRTETVRQAAETPEGLRATVVWPADRDLDKYELAALADTLIDLDPTWGSYRGVGQIRSESPTSTTIDNRLEVQLTSLNSIDPLTAFCEEQHPGSIVLIHCDTDEVLVISGEQIIRDYEGSGG